MSKKFVLSNGIELPEVAFGTFQAGEGSTTTEIVKTAINCGYRQIDTASIYKNEEEIGVALSDLPRGIKREDLIISGKVWNKDQGYESTKTAFAKSLELLKIDYFDIYMIHWPVPYGHETDYKDLNVQTWKAMEELYEEGKIRALGVSNFLPRHLENLMSRAKIKPMIDQIEINPCFHERETVEYCKNNNIHVQAWSPFKRGDVFLVNELIDIAKKHNTSVSRVCLEWCLEKGIQPIPKASSEKRMLENMPPYDFSLDEEDIKTIDVLDSPDNHAPFGDYDFQMNN